VIIVILMLLRHCMSGDSASHKLVLALTDTLIVLVEFQAVNQKLLKTKLPVPFSKGSDTFYLYH